MNRDPAKAELSWDWPHRGKSVVIDIEEKSTPLRNPRRLAGICFAPFVCGRPWPNEGDPKRAQRGGPLWERRSKGTGAVFAARRKRSPADFATTMGRREAPFK